MIYMQSIDMPSFKILKKAKFALFAKTIEVDVNNVHRVLAYPDIKLLYNRIKKSGNSSIALYLKDLIEGNYSWTQGDYHSVKDEALHSGVMSLSKLPVKDLYDINSYYLFTIFRNPYSRCLSAFLEKVADGRAGFEDVPGFQDPSTEGFERFVSYLESGGLYRDKHWWPQVALLAWPPARFSYIGQLEYLEKELRYVLYNVGINFPSHVKITGPHPAEKSGVNKYGSSKVKGATHKVSCFYSDRMYERVFYLYNNDFYVGRYNK